MATSTTATITTSISAEGLLRSINEALEALDLPVIAAWHQFAAKHGFSFRDGDLLLLPRNHGLRIPEALKNSIKVHPLVCSALFMKQGLRYGHLPSGPKPV